MVNNTQILSISCPKELVDFIEEADLSPSAEFQEAIIEKKRLWNIIKRDKEHLIKNIEALQKQLQEVFTYMEEKGINLVDFSKWRGEKYGNF